MAKRTTSDTRIDQIYDLIVAGLKRSEIHKWVRETAEWNVETRQIDRYIAAANKHLDEQAEPHRERELAKAIRRLDMLFARAFKV